MAAIVAAYVASVLIKVHIYGGLNQSLIDKLPELDVRSPYDLDDIIRKELENCSFACALIIFNNGDIAELNRDRMSHIRNVKGRIRGGDYEVHYFLSNFKGIQELNYVLSMTSLDMITNNESLLKITELTTDWFKEHNAQIRDMITQIWIYELDLMSAWKDDSVRNQLSMRMKFLIPENGDLKLNRKALFEDKLWCDYPEFVGTNSMLTGIPMEIHTYYSNVLFTSGMGLKMQITPYMDKNEYAEICLFQNKKDNCETVILASENNIVYAIEFEIHKTTIIFIKKIDITDGKKPVQLSTHRIVIELDKNERAGFFGFRFVGDLNQVNGFIKIDSFQVTNDAGDKNDHIEWKFGDFVTLPNNQYQIIKDKDKEFKTQLFDDVVILCKKSDTDMDRKDLKPKEYKDFLDKYYYFTNE